MDGTRSRSLAQAEVLRALRRLWLEPRFKLAQPSPLVELAQIARTSLTAGAQVGAQLDAWAAKWHLEDLRDVAELHVYYWAGTPDAADALRLLNPPSSMARVDLRPRPSTVVEGELLEPIVGPWSLPPVIWLPLEQLNPHNPFHPVLADPNVESEADGVKRFRAHYKAVKKITTPVPRPRKLTRHAEWYVLHVVGRWTHAAIADAESKSADGVDEVSTVTRGIHQIRDLLHTQL